MGRQGHDLAWQWQNIMNLDVSATCCDTHPPSQCLAMARRNQVCRLEKKRGAQLSCLCLARLTVFSSTRIAIPCRRTCNDLSLKKKRGKKKEGLYLAAKLSRQAHLQQLHAVFQARFKPILLSFISVSNGSITYLLNNVHCSVQPHLAIPSSLVTSCYT